MTHLYKNGSSVSAISLFTCRSKDDPGPKGFGNKYRTLKCSVICFLLWIVVATVLPANSFATDIYLAPIASGSANGIGGWGNAANATTYLSALYVTPPAAGTHIYIKTGSYSMPNNPGGNLTILLNFDDILIQGGFPLSATGTDISGYNPVTNTTTITGSSGSWVNALFSSNTATVKKVTIKGLTLLAGNVTNNIFGPNSLASNGAIFAGDFTFTDITSSNQDRPTGYGLFFLFRFTAGTSSLTLNNCYFANNSNGTQGGSVIQDSGHSGTGQIPVTINNCSFVNNNTFGSNNSWGGAISIVANSLYNINDSYFCSNTAALEGGAIGIGSTAATNAVLNVTRSTFYNNHTTTVNGHNGGAIFAQVGTLHIKNSNFYQNYTTGGGTDPFQLGGAGGAIAQATSAGISTIDGCVFYKNYVNSASATSASSSISGGGAVALGRPVTASGTFSVTNNKFVGNYSTYNNPAFADALGGALVAQKCTINDLSGNVFYQNYIRNNSSLTNIKGSDFAAFGTGVAIQNITNNTLQLAAISDYTPVALYSFVAPNTFGNQAPGNDGGVGNPTPSSCPTGISFTDDFVTIPDFNVTYTNVPVSGDVSTNDIKPTGFSYGTPVAQAGNPAGAVVTLTMNATGGYTFESNTPGVYHYDVPFCFPSSPCTIETLTITVLDKNTANPPVANPDYAYGMGAASGSGPPITSHVITNDGTGNLNGVLGAPTLTSPAPAATTGTIAVSGNDVIFTPAAGFYGEYVATYQVCEMPGGLCATTTASFYVKSPAETNSTFADDDYISTPMNTTVSGNVKTNDSDVEGNVQSVTPQSTGVTGKGSLVLAADGSYTFTPSSGFTGPVHFTYETCDNGSPSKCAMATLYVMVMAVPDLTPAILNDGTALIQGTSRDNVIIITNLGSTTTGVITINIPKMTPNFTVSIPAGSTMMDVFGGTAVNNSNWTITQQATRFVLTSNTGVTIPNNGSLAIGVKVTAIGLPNASGNLSVRIVFGSGGGEAPTTNNDDNNTYTVN
ncbi:Ig-like domain-containing protein [Dyadobacter sp. NIV53]|uniref:beta strand repeat-containing protein n=1 Tax=Dyadobacter sp. NIV53 TaxID=2861765 RepID=UPI001C87D37F|nr:Ig-like domain-containing protein [Dyadobacter sp. NIV53]